MGKNAQYDGLLSGDHQKLHFSPSKNQFFKIEKFSSQLDLKEFLENWKIEMSKRTEKDWMWCADHEKLYFSPSKNQF